MVSHRSSHMCIEVSRNSVQSEVFSNSTGAAEVRDFLRQQKGPMALFANKLCKKTMI